MNEATRAELERALGALHSIKSIAGGCISPAFRIERADGSTVFVKTATHEWPTDAFAAEANSLSVLRRSNALVIPEVYGYGASWLALEWLEPVAPGIALWQQLGSGLAKLHRSNEQRFGWPTSNYLGPLPQANQHTSNWPEFWAERRLRPLLERAAPRLDTKTRQHFDQLFVQLDDLLDDAYADGASLLHGDLWSGNVHLSARGAGVIDPASYYGHREVDLAMAALFGGFPRAFRDAYEQEWPLLPGAAARQPIYQLYYLLVHVVLFGGSYVDSTATTLRAALRRM